MGKLQRVTGDRSCWLSGHALIGRAPTCLLQVWDKRISGEHARLDYRHDRWELRDLGSRNGTLVNGQRIEPGQPTPLQHGDVICFGSSAEAWRLTDTSPPAALAMEVGGAEILRAQDGFLALPEDQSPEVYVYASHSGKWVAERVDRSWVVHDQERLSAGERQWTLHLPDGLATTWTPRSDDVAIHDVSLRFMVSADEETIAITIAHPNGEIRLPPRAHDYLLLTLARARLQDRQQAVSPEEAGWLYVDELCRMLKIDENKLGVHIFRARRALASHKIQGAAGLIQRRRATRQVRLGLPRLSEAPLSTQPNISV
ncbi:MAG: FHA domain-containing protein [Myxococcota bacterium]